MYIAHWWLYIVGVHYSITELCECGGVLLARFDVTFETVRSDSQSYRNGSQSATNSQVLDITNSSGYG
jgi:hypothetical protein